MSEAVGNVGDEVEVFTFLTTKKAVNGIDDDLDDVDVLPLVEATDVVGFCHFALMEDEVDGTGMVFYKEPVAHVFALAIDWQWLAMADVIDEERDKFLWELIGTIVIGAVGHNSRHAVGIMEGTHEVIAASLTCTIWRMGIVLGGLHEEMFAVCLMLSLR